MKYLYLDYNVYIEALENEELLKTLAGLADQGIQCLYSPAHIEEIYKVAANKKSKYRSQMKPLMDIISSVTSDMEILPSDTELMIKKEHPMVCYSRVRGMDTRERVENDSKTKFAADKNIQAYNASPEVQILGLLNIDKKLPQDFCLKEGNYPDLKVSHKQLEYTVELLFRILNFSGYCSEKSEQTTVSGTHDVSHAIYATKSDTLISTDWRFAKKCQAVYAFLGAGTSVIACGQDDIIKKISEISGINT